MSLHRAKLVSVLWVGAISVMLAVPFFAQQLSAQQPPPAVRVRGEVVGLAGSDLTVKSRMGDTVKVKLADNVVVLGVKKIAMSEITENKFVGITSKPGPDGTRIAMEVHVFPEAMRGTGEGDRDWDLAPNTKMTNANISATVAHKDGRQLTMSYKGGEVKIVVPENIPIVTYVPADRAKLVAGAKVFIIAAAGPDGTLSASRVNVGLDIAPPM